MKAKDLAREIGVSEATVSLVINGKPGISQKTREMVESKIIEMGYGSMLRQESPSPSSQGKVISFILYKENGELLGSNTFFPLILDGIESTTRKNGYTLNIINIEHERLDQDILFIKESQCAGYVIFATEMHEDVLDRFIGMGLPFVVFDNEFLGWNLNSVKVNNEQGTYLAVRHLRDMGHRKIGYLSSGLYINSFIERQKYALNAIEHLNLEGGRETVYTIGYPNTHAEEGMDALLEVVNVNDLPTAFLADNDLVAMGAIKSLVKHGYRIPEDFSFVGYDDRPLCTYMEPNLTTIRLPRESFGAEAVALLIRQIEENTQAKVTIEINGTLVVRDSVKCMNDSSIEET